MLRCWPPLPLLVSSLLSETFRDLDVGISVWAHREWRAIHGQADVLDLEVAHGGGAARYLYNVRCLARAERSPALVRGDLFGFRDLFVPIHDGRQVTAILAVGPFLTERPSRARVLSSWYAITRSRGRMSEPGFASYLGATLATLTLEGPLSGLLERMLSCFVRLVNAGRPVAAIAREVESLRSRLGEARFAERMWEATRSMVDDRTTYVWETPIKRDPLKRIGLSRAPQHVVVGMLVGGDAADPIDVAIRTAAFQRASVGFARRRGDLAVGRVADSGVTMLVDHSGGVEHSRAALVDLVTRAATTARRFGFRLHAGVAQGPQGDSLAARYRAALGAAERAVAEGRLCVLSEAHVRPARLGELRSDLAKSPIDEPDLLLPRFDRYVEAVLVHCGHQTEAVRAHFEAGLERLAEPLLESGALDARSFDELTGPLRGSPGGWNEVGSLTQAFRRAVVEIGDAVARPTRARRDRSVGRALQFAREHLAEPLTLSQVARVAGFAPGHFAKLLKRDQRVTFERYLQGLRLENAKRVLVETDLTAERVAHRSGFRSRTHFQRAFREATGVTPLEYRRQRPWRAHRRAVVRATLASPGRRVEP